MGVCCDKSDTYSFTALIEGGHKVVMSVLVLGLFFLSQQYGQSICQKATMPNIVMVMSDAFVSMN